MFLPIVTGCMLACAVLGQTQGIPEKVPARTLPGIEIPVTEGVSVKISLSPGAYVGGSLYDLYEIELRGDHNDVIRYSEIDNVRRDMARGGLVNTYFDKEFKLPLNEKFTVSMNYRGKVVEENPPVARRRYSLEISGGDTYDKGYYAIVDDPKGLLTRSKMGNVADYVGPHVAATVKMIELRKIDNEGWRGSYGPLPQELGFFAEVCKEAYEGTAGSVVEYDVPLYSSYLLSGGSSVVAGGNNPEVSKAVKDCELKCYVVPPDYRNGVIANRFKVVKVRYAVVETKSIKVTQEKGVSGLNAILLEGPPGTPLIIAFAGTVGGLLGPDWLTNYAQGIGLTPNQYNDAMLYVQDVMRRYGIEFQARLHQHRMLIAGHSLGGALASFVSASTGFRAVCFNAAPIVGMANRMRGAGVSKPEYRIVHVRVAGDPVSGLLPGCLVGEHWFVKSKSNAVKFDVSHHDLSNMDVFSLDGYEPASRHRLPE